LSAEHSDALQALLGDRDRAVSALQSEIGDWKARYDSMLTRLDELTATQVPPPPAGASAAFDDLAGKLAEFDRQQVSALSALLQPVHAAIEKLDGRLAAIPPQAPPVAAHAEPGAWAADWDAHLKPIYLELSKIDARLVKLAARPAGPAAVADGYKAGLEALLEPFHVALANVDARLAELAARASASPAAPEAAPFLHDSFDAVANQVTARLAAFDGRLTELAQRISTPPLAEALKPLLESLDAAASQVNSRLSAFDSRLDELARQGAAQPPLAEALKPLLESLDAAASKSLDRVAAQAEDGLTALASKLESFPAAIAGFDARLALLTAHAPSRESLDQAAATLGARLESLERKYTESLAALTRQVHELARPALSPGPALPLRRIVELAGLAGHASFSESTATLRLPQGLQISVDAGFTAAACDEAMRGGGVEEWVQRVRARCVALVEGGAGLSAVLLPSESCWQAAAQHDPGLAAEVLEYGVALVSPSQLLGLLRSAAAVPMPRLNPELRSQLSAVERQFAHLKQCLEPPAETTPA
jgi:hypothetical protein